ESLESPEDADDSFSLDLLFHETGGKPSNFQYFYMSIHGKFICTIAAPTNTSHSPDDMESA
ncbi:hypothetical protein E1B28_007142, partial [Marasmius oreades]